MTTKLEQLKALSKVATPAPWTYDEQCYFRGPEETPLVGCCEYVFDMISKENTELIATMRNSIDDLIAVARAAQSLLDEGHCYTCDTRELTAALEKLK